jgi:hypothetical protein
LSAAKDYDLLRPYWPDMNDLDKRRNTRGVDIDAARRRRVSRWQVRGLVLSSLWEAAVGLTLANVHGESSYASTCYGIEVCRRSFSSSLPRYASNESTGFYR